MTIQGIDHTTLHMLDEMCEIDNQCRTRDNENTEDEYDDLMNRWHTLSELVVPEVMPLIAKLIQAGVLKIEIDKPHCERLLREYFVVKCYVDDAQEDGGIVLSPGEMIAGREFGDDYQ